LLNLAVDVLALCFHPKRTLTTNFETGTAITDYLDVGPNFYAFKHIFANRCLLTL